jgi:transcriptional regulator with XRE-family HTH domain
MLTTLQELGQFVRAHREARTLTQDDLAAAVQTNRSAVAHLEQGLRLPAPDVLRRLCGYLGIPEAIWSQFERESFRSRIGFEATISELIGHKVTLAVLDPTSVSAAEQHIADLFHSGMTDGQVFDALTTVLVFYGIRRMSRAFFDRYLGAPAFKTQEQLASAIRRYQRDAVRLFSTLAEAYETLTSVTDLKGELAVLEKRPVDRYLARTEWDRIEQIADDRLPDLGYIAAARVRQERVERNAVSKFLRDLAEAIRREGAAKAVQDVREKTRRRMDSLLRKFESKVQHGLGSSLFAPDPDLLEREAALLAPKENDVERIAETQEIARRNLANYLAADCMDVYIATSMRSDADFVSVNRFVTELFSHGEVAPLKLRYFNPTQSWIEDRVAKGLVEALMLRRADLTIYMAQKSDTFGKDSEASVALGQGKPVVVYVPKLKVPEVDVDTEVMWVLERGRLEELLAVEGTEDDRDADETVDIEALASRLLSHRLKQSNTSALSGAVRRHWADFDLYGEANERIKKDNERVEYRAWLDIIVKQGRDEEPSLVTREHVISIMVATAAQFERRAKTFRAVHPLALQVIVSSGVLNGILVARSVGSCAALLRSLVENELDIEVVVDEANYMLIERTTKSTVRVISRHELLKNAFASFYGRRGTRV